MEARKLATSLRLDRPRGEPLLRRGGRFVHQASLEQAERSLEPAWLQPDLATPRRAASHARRAVASDRAKAIADDSCSGRCAAKVPAS